MTGRETLLKVLESAESAIYWNSSDKGFVEKVADHLIANDVVPVVLCKDCKNRDDITGECKHPKAVGWDVLIPEDDDFCSYGGRRTE
jgi:hypothetical protein